MGKQKKEDVLPPEKMALILNDFMLLEATYNTKLIRVDNKDELMLRYSNEIFDHYEISKEKFDLSYEYYTQHTEEFEAVLELVFEELNKMETESTSGLGSRVISDSTLVSE
jgi:hypothetical protein